MNKLRISLIFLSLALLIGCKKSPESDIITNKNEDKLEKAIVKEANDQEQDDDVQHKKDEFKVSTGDLQVVVDAQVNAIKGSMPIVRTIPREITSEDVKTWVEILFGGQKAYDPATPKSKGELEK